MNQLERYIKIGGGIVAIADVILRYLNIKDLSFLTVPILPLNLLELILAVIVVYLIYEYLPNNIHRKRLQSKAEEFYKNWKKYKNIILKYTEKPNGNYQQEYQIIREKIYEDFNYFAKTMKDIQDGTHRKYNDIALGNLEEYISIRSISDWASERMHRKILPNELDNFDCFIIGLKEYYKNPENYKNL